jgi:hypothetical protein
LQNQDSGSPSNYPPFRIDFCFVYSAKSEPFTGNQPYINMKRIILATFSLLFVLKASATTFNFGFDNNPTTGIQAPIVGTGAFTFANDPGNGTFAFNSLGAFSIAFSFVDGETFTSADIASDLSQVLVVLSGSGMHRRLQFSDTGSGGGGPFAGSIDFTSSTGALSFEPSYFGGNLDLYFTNAFFGSYLATTGNVKVPDAGSTMMLVLLSVAAIVGLRHVLRDRSSESLRS